jgi:superfamily II DNA or RNA helicase
MSESGFKKRRRTQTGGVRGPGGRVLVAVSARANYEQRLGETRAMMEQATPMTYKSLALTGSGATSSAAPLEQRLSSPQLHVVQSPHVAALKFVNERDYMGVADTDEMRQLLAASGLGEALQAPLGTERKTPMGAARKGGRGAAMPQSRLVASDRFLTLEPLTEPWPLQWEAVHFMEKHEAERVEDISGGIIADEMGLGKTFQTLLHIMRHLQALCRTTGKPFGQPTLVVFPKTLLATWRAEIARHFPRDTFSVLVLAEGANAHITARDVLEHYTLVLTTYPTIARAHSARDRKRGAGERAPYAALFEVAWWRIVADESHVFANRETARFAAMCQLNAHHKWLLTGTPILNDAGDACAALSFLGVPDARLPVDQSARSERVRGTLAADRSAEKRARHGSARDSFVYLLEIRRLLHLVMLRRVDDREYYTKTTRLADWETQAERDLYALYYARFRANCFALRKGRAHDKPRARDEGEACTDEEDDEDVGSDSATGEPPAKRARIESDGKSPHGGRRAAMDTLTVDILRMRQICAYPCVIGDLALPPHVLLEQGYDPVQRGAANTQDRIARHAPGGARVPSLAYLAAARYATDVVNPNYFLEQDEQATTSPYLARMAYSAGPDRWAALVPDTACHCRLDTILKHVHGRVLPFVGTKARIMMRNFRSAIPRNEKYLIFSEWVKVLENMMHAFGAARHYSFLLTGDQSSAERDCVLREFARSDTHRILFISLHVGSNGLNIPCATYVSHVDPWWNPQTMRQADARMRPSEEKHGYVFDVIMHATVEEDVKRMADEKSQISRLLLNTDEATLREIAATLSRLEAAAARDDMECDEEDSAAGEGASHAPDDAGDDPHGGGSFDALASMLASRGSAVHAARSAMLELVDRVIEDGGGDT